ncbi:MAG: hypothetical protein KTR31_17305 [Myxococcales bacterium]|nr:hypothetical protein [Myxococcales bacterium]
MPGTSTTLETLPGNDVGCEREADAALLASCTAGVQAVVAGISHSDLDAALEAAADGDTVWVCPGVHEAELWIDDRTLDLAAIDPQAETVLSGADTHRVLTLLHSTVSLDGLTIAHGNTTEGTAKGELANFGGGMLVVDSAVDVTCSTLRDNVASIEGGALYAVGSAVRMVDSALTDNAHGALHFNGDLSPSEAVTFDASRILAPRMELVLTRVTIEGSAPLEAPHIHVDTPLWFELGTDAATMKEPPRALLEDVDLLNNTTRFVTALLSGSDIELTRVRVEGNTGLGHWSAGMQVSSTGPTVLSDLEILDNTGNPDKLMEWPIGSALQLGLWTHDVTLAGAHIEGNEGQWGPISVERRGAWDPDTHTPTLRASDLDVFGNAAWDASAAVLELSTRGNPHPMGLELETSDFGSGATSNGADVAVRWEGTEIETVEPTDVISL